jgi:RNA polymerase sigma factor (sigma-70 family)
MFPDEDMSADVLEALKQGDNKEEHFMRTLKHDRYMKDSHSRLVRDENGLPVKLPEREISLDRLLDEGWDYPSSEPSPEERLIAEMEKAVLRRCIPSLPADEMEVILALFFSNGGDGMTERECAAIIGVTQKTVNNRKRRALAKLREMMGS